MTRADGPAGRLRAVRRHRARSTLSAPTIAAATPDAVPVDTERSTLYTAADLYGTGAYADSLDARAYAWSLTTGDSASHLARALHDHAMDEALDAWVAGRRLVGVMGGHAVQRGDPAYAEAARLGRQLGRAGLVVATGGGPGAMEAANLGALLAPGPDQSLDGAVDLLSRVPAYRPVDAWLAPARSVLSTVSDSPQHPEGESLAVPTWFYGHEPTNVFATAIAKYVRNALREAILLRICEAGIVFLPGAAGTVQEVFQDACENYYAEAPAVAPMVLVGATYWTRTVPVWPLLQALAAGRAMQDHVHLVDSAADAVALLTG